MTEVKSRTIAPNVS